jgi:cardiolipin synthase
VYLSDDDYGIVGTINLDYRSLVHHFENRVWLYKHNVLSEIKSDFAETMERSIEIKEDTVKENLLQKFIRALVKIFAPML